MNLRRLTGRAAAAGAISALAAGALVAIASPAAQAADPAGVGYICHNAAFNADVPVLVGATGLPSEVTAGKTVPVGDVPVTFTLTREVLDGMAAKGINQVGVSSNDLALAIGSTTVGLTGVSVAKAATPATGDMVMTAASQNAQFVAPAAGTYDLKLPPTFTGTVDTNLAPLAVNCTIVDPSASTIGSVTSTAPVGPQGEGYTCTVFGNALPIFVEGVAPTLTSPTAGKNVAAGTVPISATVTLAADVADQLKEQTGATAVGFDSSDYAVGLGSLSIPASGLTASKVTSRWRRRRDAGLGHQRCVHPAVGGDLLVHAAGDVQRQPAARERCCADAERALHPGRGRQRRTSARSTSPRRPRWTRRPRRLHRPRSRRARPSRSPSRVTAEGTPSGKVTRRKAARSWALPR